MSVLFTAFRGIHNSSYQLTQAIKADKLYLTNTFEGIDRDIDNFDFSIYKGIIMFGLDNRLKSSVRIEPVAMLGSDIRSTVYNIGDFANAFEHYNLKVSIAKKPTAYLCNYAYYRVLQKVRSRALFIHIPPERHLNDEIKQCIISVVNSIILGD